MQKTHQNFIAFINKLISCLGFSKVIGGEIPKYPSSSLTREWLAAEILCTWKWQGGSAQHSFLPSLIEYIKEESSFLASIAKILLEGTVLHGYGFNNSSWILFNSWFPSDQEVNKIQEPFLRALVTVLLVLSAKDNTHRKSDVSVFFKSVKGMLINATVTNRAYLRVLPYVMGAIIQPLCEKLDSDHGNDNVIDGSLLGWLHTCISSLSDQSSKEGKLMFNPFNEVLQLGKLSFLCQITLIFFFPFMCKTHKLFGVYLSDLVEFNFPFYEDLIFTLLL